MSTKMLTMRSKRRRKRQNLNIIKMRTRRKRRKTKPLLKEGAKLFSCFELYFHGRQP